MSYQKLVLRIVYIDGGEEMYPCVGGDTRGTFINEGVLHVWYKGGRMAREEHVGSFPLVNIRKYTLNEEE